MNTLHRHQQHQEALWQAAAVSVAHAWQQERQEQRTSRLTWKQDMP